MASHVFFLFTYLVLFSNANVLFIPTSLGDRTPFKRDMFGTNQAWFRHSIKYNDPRLREHVQENKISSLRWPAGTPSNHLDWESGMRHPWLKEKEFGNRGECKTKYYQTVEDIERQLKNRREKSAAPIQELQGFASWVDNDDKVSKDLVVVVNMCSLSPDNSQRLARRLTLQNMDAERVTFELGNEYYLPSANVCCDSASDYVDLAKQHAAQIQLGMPGAKIILGISPMTFLSDEFFSSGGKQYEEKKSYLNCESGDERTKQNFWNAELRVALNKQGNMDWFHAFALHMYGEYVDSDNLDVSGNANDIEKMFIRTVSHVEQRFKFAINKLRENYFGPSKLNGKPMRIWMTEWHMRRRNNPYSSQYPGGLYSINFMMKLLLRKDIHFAQTYSLSFDADLAIDACTCGKEKTTPWNMVCPEGTCSKQIENSGGKPCKAELYEGRKDCTFMTTPSVQMVNDVYKEIFNCNPQYVSEIEFPVPDVQCGEDYCKCIDGNCNPQDVFEIKVPVPDVQCAEDYCKCIDEFHYCITSGRFAGTYPKISAIFIHCEKTVHDLGLYVNKHNSFIHALPPKGHNLDSGHFYKSDKDMTKDPIHVEELPSWQTKQNKIKIYPYSVTILRFWKS